MTCSALPNLGRDLCDSLVFADTVIGDGKNEAVDVAIHRRSMELKNPG